MSETRYVVAIIVDPEFGERVRDVLARMPAWLVDSAVNRRAAEVIWAEDARVDHTQPGGLTTFPADATKTRDEWCAGILWSVAGHHDMYSHHPGYSGVEVFGTEPTPALIRALDEYRLSEVSLFPGGFTARTAGGVLADSPNYPNASGHIDESVAEMSALDWALLSHAYGDASDVRVLLEHARRAPAGGRYTDEPWFSLWSAVCHQGDVYTASYAAVPELVAIARARHGEHAAARECLLLAGMIELERALPDTGRRPPALPPQIGARYDADLVEGARMAEALLAVEPDPDYARGLEAAAAAMRGNSATARRLADPDADEA